MLFSFSDWFISEIRLSNLSREYFRWKTTFWDNQNLSLFMYILHKLNYIPSKISEFHAAIVSKVSCSHSVFWFFPVDWDIYLGSIGAFCLVEITHISVISIEIWKLDTGNVLRYLETMFSFFRSMRIFVNVFGKMIIMVWILLRSTTYIFQLWLFFIQEQPSTCSSRMNNNLHCSEWRILRY